MSHSRRTDDGHQYTVKSNLRGRRTSNIGGTSNVVAVRSQNATYCDEDLSRPFYEVVVIEHEIQVKVNSRNRWISHLIEQETSSPRQMLKWVDEWASSKLMAQSLFIRLLPDYRWYFEQNQVRFMFASDIHTSSNVRK